MNFKNILLVTGLLLLFPMYSVAEYNFLFTPRITIDEEYTDNVDSSSGDEKKEEEFITTISMGGTLEARGKRSGAVISYDPEYAWYHRFSDNDTLRHTASANGWFDVLKHTHLTVFDSFRLTEDPDYEGNTDTTIRRGRETYYTNDIGVNLAHSFGPSKTVNLGYEYGILENDDPDIEDNKRHAPSIGYSHQISSFYSMNTSVSYTRGEFDVSDTSDQWEGNISLTRKFSKALDGFLNYDHTIMDYKGETIDYQVYHPSLGLGYTFPDGNGFSLNVGYYIQDRENGDDDSGLTFSGNLGKNWELKRGNIKLDGFSGYEESNFGSENLGFTRYYGGSGAFDYSITRSLTANIFSSYRRNEYVDQEPDRDDDIIRAGVGLAYRPQQFRWLSLALNYSYYDIDSTEDDEDLEENRVNFRVIIIPPKPYRFN